MIKFSNKGKKYHKGPEAVTMTAIRDYLDHLQAMGRCIYNRINSGKVFTGDRVFNGAKPGTADFECAFYPNGRHVSIEVKSEDGKQSDAQKIYQRNVEYVGGVYILARSILDVENKLKQEKILL